MIYAAVVVVRFGGGETEVKGSSETVGVGVEREGRGESEGCGLHFGDLKRKMEEKGKSECCLKWKVSRLSLSLSLGGECFEV